MAEIYDYDTSAANNNSPPPDGFPEGMNYSQVNDAAREVMAVLARYVETLGGVATTGADNAYAVSLTLTGAQASGRHYILQANHTNTGPATLSVNSQAPISLRNPLGAELAAGQIINGGMHLIIHDGTNFRVFGITPTAGELRLLPGISASETLAGLAAIATQDEVNTGTDATKFVTPATLGTSLTASLNTSLDARTASDSQTGLAELATQDEVNTGTDTTRIVTPATLATRLRNFSTVQNKVKSLDESRTSNAYVTDTHLKGITLVGGRRYTFKLFLAGLSGGSTGFKGRFNFTHAPQSLRGIRIVNVSPLAVPTIPPGIYRTDFTGGFEMVIANVPFSFEVMLEGSFKAASQGGNMDFQWGRVNNDTQSSILYEGSYAQITRIG